MHDSQPSFWHRPSVWFIVVMIIILVSEAIYYAITKQTGTVFWIIFAVAMIILIASILILIFEVSMSPSKKKAKIDVNDTYGMSQFSAGGSQA